MALSHSALLEVLDALKASDSTDVIRRGCTSQSASSARTATCPCTPTWSP